MKKITLLVVLMSLLGWSLPSYGADMMSTALIAGGQFGGSATAHGAMALAYGQKCSFKNPFACYMAWQAIRQAKHDYNQRNRSYDTANNLFDGMEFGGTFEGFEDVNDYCSTGNNASSDLCKVGGIDTIPDGTGTDQTMKDLNDFLKNSATKKNFKDAIGGIVDPNTGNLLKDGQAIDPAKTGLAQALSQAGASPSLSASVQSALANAGKNAAKKILSDSEKLKKKLAMNGVQSGGASGGSLISNRDLASELEDDVDFNSLWNKVGNEKSNDGKLGGNAMKKLIGNNEAIGVKSDSLFKMIHRRYNNLKRSRTFVH